MKARAKSKPPLSPDESSYLSAAYKCILADYRNSLKKISKLHSRFDDPHELELLDIVQKKTEEELRNLCNEMLVSQIFKT